MDRGRGRGRGSYKARRSQGSPAATTSDSTYTGNSNSSPVPLLGVLQPRSRTAWSPQAAQPDTYRAPYTGGGIMRASNDPNYTAATPKSWRLSSQHPLSFQTPETLRPASASASTGVSTRKRSRANAMGYDGAADEVPVEKGGHTLRKRSRIDYTQLEDIVDDDVLASEQLKSDAIKKPAPGSTASTRRRRTTQDLSGDESDEGSVGQRRRRVDKTPSGPRPTSSRRKASSKQPSQPPTVHSPSDNEVQDTILVGGVMDDSTSDPQSSPELRKVAPLRGSPRPHVNGHELHRGLDGASDAKEPPLEATSSPNPASKDQTLVEDEAPDRTPVSSMKLEHVQEYDFQSAVSQAAIPTTEDNDDDAENQLREESAQAIKHDHETPDDAHQEKEHISDAPALDSSSTQDVQQQTLISKHEDGHYSELPASSTPPESSEPHVPQPRHIPAVDRVYETAQQETYRAPLIPYEDEDVVLPASWTEQVIPQESVENGIATPAPTLTPRPSPQPKALPVHFSDIWDPTTTLTTKKFYSLYHADSAHRKRNGQPRITLMAFRAACARRRTEALKNPAPAPAAEPTVTKKAVKSKAKGKAKGKRGRTPASSVEADSPAVPDTLLAEAAAASFDETPRGSPVPDSQPPTAAPSPEPEVDPELDNQADLGPDVAAEATGIEAENGPVEPEFVTKHPKKQYLFKKLSDVDTMEEALENPEEQDTDTLYAMLESGAKALKAYEDEYRELKKITDDEDNAKRRAQNDKAIENWDARQKLDEAPVWRRTFDDVVQKVPATFDVKGVRAPKPYVDDPEQEHQRQEDKIMAQAYGFDYKSDKTSIGKQDPISQRFETAEGRLRDRRQTQKAADAAEEGVIVEGKRTRKPRVLDDHSAPVSRATTPVPAPRQRQRKTVAIAAAEDVQLGAKEATPEPMPKKRGFRAKAKLTTEEEVPQPGINQNGNEETLSQEKPKITRKRGRAAAAPHPLATTTYAEPEEEALPKEEPQPPAKRQRKSKEATSNGTEIPAGSFYSQPTTDEQQRRPSTSSSSGTANTAATIESSYSLRDKKKRNFAAENDPIAETRPKRIKLNPSPAKEKPFAVPEEPPKKKLVRVRRKKPAMSVADENSAPSTPQFPPSGPASPAVAPANMMHTFNAHPDLPISDPAPSRKLMKIKIVGQNHNLAAAAAAAAAPLHPAAVAVPSPAAQSPAAQTPPTPVDQPKSQPPSRGGSRKPSLEPGEEKAYNEMSKSEKMSWSMKRRWAKGEMQSAVEKRKNTLARKAEAKAAAPPPDLTPKPLQPASGPPPALSPAGSVSVQLQPQHQAQQQSQHQAQSQLQAQPQHQAQQKHPHLHQQQQYFHEQQQYMPGPPPPPPHHM